MEESTLKKENTTEKAEKENDVITNDKTDTAVQKAKSLIIKLEDLVPFKDHPYKVIENESMIELTESIAEHGILNPLLVRPLEGEDGQVRNYFRSSPLCRCAKARHEKSAVHCPLHRPRRRHGDDGGFQLPAYELLPSEKAFAYKMKMDAIKRMPGRKPAENVSPVETQKRSSEIIAKEAGESRAQIDRYIRLTCLVPELLQYVDEGKIGMRPAVEMSYLDEEIQRDIVDRIDEKRRRGVPVPRTDETYP